MIDLPGRIVLQTNVAAVTKDIESALKGIKGSINIFSPGAIKNADKMHQWLFLIGKEVRAMKPNMDALAAAFKRMASAATVLSKAVTGNQKALHSLNQQHKTTATETKKHMTVMQQFGDQAGIAAKRYTAFTIAVGIGFGAIRATQAAIKDSIVFQDKLVKMSQVSGKSLQSLKPLSQEISRLSSSLGVSSDKIADVSLVLLQAGYTSRDVKKSLDALAKVELAPSFGDMTAATEAAIAIMSQFGTTTDDLKGQLSAINKVSADFAVEASDIVIAIQRAGAAFGQLAKQTANPKDSLNEFIALFTAVRSTTRESAETIATGLRTIFTRLQRPQTLKFFDDLHIKLTDANHQFIGLYPAIQKISEGIKGLPATDPRFAMIGEELGGFRQINKTIPLLTQLEKAQEAYNVARGAGNSLDESAAEASQSLAVQLKQVHESFLSLIRDVADTDTFKTLVHTFLGLAKGAIAFGNAIKPLIPLIAIIAGFQGVKASAQFFPAMFHRVVGASVGRASGGSIPGTGNTDSVHAMLTPGEFVINKASAQKIGYGTLSRMNRYAQGGPVHMVKGGRAPEFVNPSEEKLGLKGTEVIQQELRAIRGVFGNLIQNLKVIKTGARPSNTIEGGLIAGSFSPTGIGNGTKISYSPSATHGTAIHEAGHALDFALGTGSMTNRKYLSGQYGTIANKFAMSQVKKTEALLAASGHEDISDPYRQYRMQPHELFAFGVQSLSAKKRAALYKAIQRERNASHFDPMSVLGGTSLGVTNYPGTATGTTGVGLPSLPFSPLGLATGSLHGGPTFGNPMGNTTYGPARPNLLQRLYNRFANARQAGGPISRGIGSSIDRIRGFMNGNGIPIAASIGAVGAQQYFGTVSSNKAGERGRGAVGEIAAGTLGGVAAGAAAGGAPGAVVGALIGLSLALHETTEDLKRFNLSDALEEAIDTQKKGGTINFGKVEKAFAEASSPAILDYITAIGSTAAPAALFDKENKGEDAFAVYRRGIQQARIGRSETFSKEHAGEIQTLLQPEFAAAGKKYTSFQEFAKNEPALMDKLRKMLPHLGGQDITQVGKKLAGLGGGGMNLDNAINGIEAMVNSMHDLANAMKTADIASVGLSHAIELNTNLFGGGIAKFSDRSALITNPSLATFGQTAHELQGLPPEVGMAAYTQANIRRIGMHAFQAISNLKGPNQGSALTDIMDQIEKEAGGFGIKSKGSRNMIETMLNNALEEGGQKPTNFRDFMKRISNPLQELLGPAAEVRQHQIGARNDFLGAMNQVTNTRLSAGQQRFGALTTGVEAFNKQLEFQGITQGSMSNYGGFIAGQNTLAPGMGMNPEAIGNRMAALQSIREKPDNFTVKQLAKANEEFAMLARALENLTRATEHNTLIEKQLAEINANRGERIGLGQELLTANPAQRANIIRSLHMVNAFRGGQLDITKMTPEAAGMFFERVNKSNNIFPGLQEQVNEQILNKLGLQGDIGARRAGLQGQVLNNFNIQKRAQNIHADLQEAGAETAEGQAIKRFQAQMQPLFENLGAVADRIPRQIELKGKHIVQVNINGAEAFANLKPQFENFVAERVKQGIDGLIGQLRQAPPNGPGLPIRQVGVG